MRKSSYDKNYQNRKQQQQDDLARMRKAAEDLNRKARAAMGASFDEAFMRTMYGGSAAFRDDPKAYADTLTMRMVRDQVDRINGVYRPSPIADEAEKGLVIEGTSRRN